jgi:hypothetical protein
VISYVRCREEGWRLGCVPEGQVEGEVGRTVLSMAFSPGGAIRGAWRASLSLAQ